MADRDMCIVPQVISMRDERAKHMELWRQGKRCTVCGSPDYIPGHEYVQDKSEYPEGIPDDLMALPLCRACLRESTEATDIGPCDKACFMIFPCLAITPAMSLTRKLREGSMGFVKTVHTDTLEQAGPRAIVM